MNKDKKLLLLQAPLIFMVLGFVPVIFFEIVPNVFRQKIPYVFWIPFILMLCIFEGIWSVTFDYISTDIYIGILIVYTVVSWTWILRQKKGNLIYFAVWLTLCVLSTLMYWKCGDLCHILLYG